MYHSVADFTGPLSHAQRDALDCTLEAGERILWATRPRASILPYESANCLRGRLILFVLVLLFFAASVRELCYLLPTFYGSLHAVCEQGAGWLRLSILLLLLMVTLLAFVLSGRYLISRAATCLCVRRNRRHTLYILTDRRALVLEPTFEGWHTESFSLDEDMVLERSQHRARGELLFRADTGLQPGQERRRGWSALENAGEAEARVRAALAQRMASCGNQTGEADGEKLMRG